MVDHVAEAATYCEVLNSLGKLFVHQSDAIIIDTQAVDHKASTNLHSRRQCPDCGAALDHQIDADA